MRQKPEEPSVLLVSLQRQGNLVLGFMNDMGPDTSWAAAHAMRAVMQSKNYIVGDEQDQRRLKKMRTETEIRGQRQDAELLEHYEQRRREFWLAAMGISAAFIILMSLITAVFLYNFLR